MTMALVLGLVGLALLLAPRALWNWDGLAVFAWASMHLRSDFPSEEARSADDWPQAVWTMRAVLVFVGLFGMVLLACALFIVYDWLTS